MPILITIADDLRAYMTIAVDKDGRRSPITITSKLNLIDHLSGVMRRILWGLGMTMGGPPVDVQFGLPVEVYMACQVTQALNNDARSVLQVIADQSQIDSSRIVPIYPSPAHAVRAIEEAQMMAMAAVDRANRLEQELQRNRGGW